MFAENRSHRQRDLFDDLLLSLPESKRAKALASREYAFYEEVFCRIEESAFAVLYPSRRGRPNRPVNAMVAALVLRELRRFTYEQLFEAVDFDVLTRLALGLTDMSETPFCPATLFNFQQRLLAHEAATGENLLEGAFASLTASQLKRFGVRTDIQRCDSFRAMSNIANYGRVRLLAEVLLRLLRVLPAAERERFADLFGPYAEHGSDGFAHRLEDGAIPRELKRLAGVYSRLHAELAGECRDTEPFAMFERVFREQFATEPDGTVRARPRKEVGSGALQSPDDPDAAYNAKNGRPQKGHKVNVVETANPGNDVNLITDVSTTPNNVHDGTMLADRMDGIGERTPDLAEMHTDGGYGGAALDPKMKEHGVLHAETGTRMGKARVNMRYARSGDAYDVSCPGGQTVRGERTARRWKAVFAEAACADCPFRDECPSRTHPGKRTFYFEESWAKSYLRSRNIERVPPERRTLRANVEATMKQFTGCFNHKGKLRVRGLARTAMQMLAAAIAINFGRIFRRRAALRTCPATALAILQAASGPLRTVHRLLRGASSRSQAAFGRFARRIARSPTPTTAHPTEPRNPVQARMHPMLPELAII
jgi:hypothetical protein